MTQLVTGRTASRIDHSTSPPLRVHADWILVVDVERRMVMVVYTPVVVPVFAPIVATPTRRPRTCTHDFVYSTNRHRCRFPDRCPPMSAATTIPA